MCSLFHLCRSRGWELYHEGKLEEAIAEWRVAADLDPEDGYILTSIGQAQSELGRQEEAFFEWQAAIHLEPEYDAPYLFLADALLEAGYTDKALATVRTAIRLCPASAQLCSRLGHYLVTKANQNKEEKDIWGTAATAFQQALGIKPTDHYAQSYLAKIQWFLGRKQEAIATVRATIAVVPDSIEAHLQLTEYQAAMGQFRGMKQTIDATNELPDPEEKVAHYYFDLQRRLWIEFRPMLLGSVGMAAILAGVWFWYRRRG